VKEGDLHVSKKVKNVYSAVIVRVYLEHAPRGPWRKDSVILMKLGMLSELDEFISYLHF
jgi:hypothetical protein